MDGAYAQTGGAGMTERAPALADASAGSAHGPALSLGRARVARRSPSAAARRPRRALQVDAGHVDLFAVPRRRRPAEGRAPPSVSRRERRDHLGPAGTSRPMSTAQRSACSLSAGRVLKRLMLDRAGMRRPRLRRRLDRQHWIAAIAELPGWNRARPSASARSSSHGSSARAARRVASSGLRVERGEIAADGRRIRLPRRRPPLPFASGMWIEAREEVRVRVLDATALTGTSSVARASTDSMRCAMPCVREPLADDAEREASALARAHASSRPRRQWSCLNDLAAVIVPRRRGRHRSGRRRSAPRRLPRRRRSDGRARAVRRAGAASRGLRRDVVEIAQRVAAARPTDAAARRTGGARMSARWSPGAAKRAGRSPSFPSARRYIMVEPSTERAAVSTPTLATELAPEAIMFYRAAAARAAPLARSAVLLLRRGIRAAMSRGCCWRDGDRPADAGPPLITQVLIDSVIPRTELDQLAYLCRSRSRDGVRHRRLSGHARAWRCSGSKACSIGSCRPAVIDRLLRLPVSFFREYTVGDLVDRALAIDAVRRAAHRRALRGLLAGLFCVVQLRA